MNSKLMILCKAVIALVVGLFLIFLPKVFVGWFTQVPLDDLGTFLASLFGAMLVGIAIVEYFVSGATASHLRKNACLGFAVGDTAGLVLTLIAQIKGLLSGTGWILVVLWVLTAATSVYLYLTLETK